ncbi:MAG: glycosyltransferase family 4 protein [bacterium]|nr:glycosyltransferase family 4 protein [bacterium]
MKLLIVTQKVDKKDPTLGFFHSWIEEFAKRCESAIVICLEKGQYNLPHNVQVFSLGKEQKASRFKILFTFYFLLFSLRHRYDAVFVHMNEEYVLLAGLFWRLTGKKIFFWRNHPRGGIFTRLSVFLSDRVFYTSNLSFTAGFKNASVMPAGVDTSIFKPSESFQRRKHSICMVGRVAKIKGIDVALRALKFTAEIYPETVLTIVGPTAVEDEKYRAELQKYIQENNLSGNVVFKGALPQSELPVIYGGHEIYLNLTDDGSFDKTIVEAAGCGSFVVTSNSFLFGHLPKECATEKDPQSVARSLTDAFKLQNREKIAGELEVFANNHSLSKLMEKVTAEMIAFGLK